MHCSIARRNAREDVKFRIYALVLRGLKQICLKCFFSRRVVVTFVFYGRIVLLLPLPLYVSVRLSVCLCLSMSVSVSVWLSICLSVSLCLSLSLFLSRYTIMNTKKINAVNHCTRLPRFPQNRSFLCLSVFLGLSVCLSLCLSV